MHILKVILLLTTTLSALPTSAKSSFDHSKTGKGLLNGFVTANQDGAYEYNDIMIIGGRNAYSLDDVEIVAINGTATCPKPADYPVEAHGMVAEYVEGKALVCGGISVTSDCFALTLEFGCRMSQ